MRAATALGLYGVVLVLTSGVRTLVQWRRYGDTGWRFHRTSVTGVVAQALLVVAGLLVCLAAVAGLAAGAAHEPLGLAWLTDADTAAAPVSAAVGVGLVVAGTVVTWAAQLQMGASWRIGVDPTEPTPLVTDGLFRRVRNPIYTGMAVCFVGEAVLVPNVLAGAALVVGLVGVQLQVRRVEEPHLRASHGVAYLAWGATSGRFVPGIGRLRHDEPHEAPR